MKFRRLSVRGLMWVVLFMALLMGAMRCAYTFETVFAPGVQRGLFDERLIGMTKEEVLGVHGPPLIAAPYYGNELIWIYSRQARPWSGYYWRLELWIDAKTQRVVRYFHRFYDD